MSEASTRIAVTMLQFMQPTPWPSSPAQWWLCPDPRRLRHAELCAALEAMPKPVVLGALVERGCVAVWPLDGAPAAARARLEHGWRNQLDDLREKLAHLVPGGGPVQVLLELEAEALVLSSGDLEDWAREYCVITGGWTLSDSEGDARAPVRLLLRRPDGTWSPGMSCAVRPPAT